ncbi:MAG: TonB family protein [candidate division WOR-3 bacterium]
MRDHKRTYGIYIRAGILCAIIIILFLFLTLPYAEPEPYKLTKEVIGMVNEITTEIDKQIEPIDNDVRPKPPQVVIPATNPDEGIATITPTDLIEDIIPTKPSGPEIEIVPYYKVEIKPQPVYMPQVEYPSLALQAGIEGKTVVQMLVDIDGKVIDVQVIKSSGSTLLDEAAISAARKSIFTPARQRDRLVRVWVARTIEFKIK